LTAGGVWNLVSSTRPWPSGVRIMQTALHGKRLFPDTARAMSQENVKVVELAYAALNSGDIATVVGLCHPDVVLTTRTRSSTALSIRGMRGSSSSSR
jgi:hypothetical protein